MSFCHEVLTRREPSLSPRGGSLIAKAIKRTETIDKIGVTRNPQFQEPVAAAMPDPVMNPRPLIKT